MSVLAASAKGFGAAELNRDKTELIPIVKTLVNWYPSITRGMDPGMLTAGQLQQECIGMPALQYLEVIRSSTECIDA